MKFKIYNFFRKNSISEIKFQLCIQFGKGDFMFIEKIEEQLLEEIQEELDEEYHEIVANWDGELIDLEYEDFEDKLRSEIFSDYLNVPLNALEDMIDEHYPFLSEKKIYIDPHSEVIISEDGEGKEVNLRVYIDHYPFDKSVLSDSELQQLDKLLEELTQLYEELDINTTLFISPLSTEEVSESHFDVDDDDDEEHEFVQLSF